VSVSISLMLALRKSLLLVTQWQTAVILLIAFVFWLGFARRSFAFRQLLDGLNFGR
jgi:hypothetical protein